MEPDLMTLKLIFSLGLAMENGTSLHLNFAKWKNGIEKGSPYCCDHVLL